jgi:mycothiol synthase
MTCLRRQLSWRPLAEPDLPALAELAAVCLAADGGQPFAASLDFLRQRYLADAETVAAFDAGQLTCAASVRTVAGAPPGTQAVTSGLVHPAWRRRGLGGQLFGWATARAGQDGVRAETEALSDDAHALYLSRGLSQIFAEDVMQLPAARQLAVVQMPVGLTLSQWGELSPARFYAVYEAAFRERPGFPGWPQAQWIEWISDDKDFRPEWTLLATADGTDAGFIACAAPGWIEQLGVVPQARGQDVGASLIAEAVRRMRSAGESSITLNVNINNPHAAALYRRLGFIKIGRRARYQA